MQQPEHRLCEHGVADPGRGDYENTFQRMKAEG
jgi:hypothetical protein